MRITRIYLRNYRVFETELDLPVPAGLVGIYGVNGGGKSSLIESVLWTLYGRSRTKNEEIRTTGVLADCITELEFEHESHLYSVRRTISGINSTVKAEAFADGSQVANGVGDVKRYVHSVLGMDDAAFRASVFAEQKQVAAFSLKRPAERRDLVLKLLGITPLDAARDRARADAKSARERVEQVRAMLADLDILRPAVEQAVAAADIAAADAESEAAALMAATARSAAAESAHASLDEVRIEHDALLRDGKMVRAEIDQANQRVAAKVAQLEQLAAAEVELVEVTTVASGLEELEAELLLVERVASAEEALARLPAIDEPPEPDETGLEAAVRAHQTERAELDGIAGELRAATAEVDRAGVQMQRSASLSAEEDCPVCGQALGSAFASVHDHRRRELAEAEARVADLEHRRAALSASVERGAAEVGTLTAQVQAARSARQAADQRRAQRKGAAQSVAESSSALNRPVEAGEADRMRADVASRRRAARRVDQLVGELRRKPDTEAELARESDHLVDAEGRRTVLLEKVKSLSFDPERLASLRQARDDAAAAADQQSAKRDAARTAAERSRFQAEVAGQRLADAEAQHLALVEQSETSRHLGRLADLLNAFRTNVVATVGPRLSAQAAELFSEFTDGEYEALQVHPETYDIQIFDGGHAFGMDRFSGSEIDLANLALRIAISEHVRFQSGGAVGLLVLDEVFGPLDDDRKERMLLALQRLRARFGQVLVVTHANEIKEQLPSAIEVIKLPGRRATARVVGI